VTETTLPSLTSTYRGRPPHIGRTVRLRDVTLADAAMLDDWYAQREPGSFNDFGQPHKPVPRDVLAAGPLRDEQRGTLIVERLEDGAPLGSVSWHVRRYGPNIESACFNFGIELLSWARGHGYGTEAQRLLADWLFLASDINRVEASTDVENLPEQRSLEKAGFLREGVQRGCQFRAGAYHDTITYARVRRDGVEAPG
jgi:RimJ/RimL family protein N-acetyltransferase